MELTTWQQRIVAVLNEDLQPWTFDGSEPLCERLFAAVSDTIAERDRLRAALVKLVGMDGKHDLEEMEAVMRLMPAPTEDKAATIDAIHALLATC